LRTVIMAIVLVLFLPRFVEAQLRATEGVAMRLESGDTVYVLDHASREIAGVFGKFSDSSITLMVNGDLRHIDFEEVRQITRRGGDSLWNGALIGGGLGASLGGLQHLGVSGGAVVWGGIGALIDATVAGRVVVYRSPARTSFAVGPWVTERGRGLRVAVSF
jgi:hypothetical protein